MSGPINPGPPRAVKGNERVELELLRRALIASGDVACCWDLLSDSLSWSSNAHRLLGLDDTVDISTRSSFICRVNGADLSILSCIQENRSPDGASYEIEYRLRRSDGGFCWVQDFGVLECSQEPDAGESGPGRAVGVIRVITERKEREARLEWLTNHDEVTGHYNRVRLRDLLDHTFAYSGRYDSPGAYLSVAIDDFAIISDSFGQENMDRAVIAVGQALDKCLRACDVVGRVAPDQFGVILSSCQIDGVQVIADRILNTVMQASVDTSEGTIRMTVSIGGVNFPQTVRAPHDAIIKADVALSRARRNGQNCFVAYDLTDEQRNDSRRTLSIAKEIQTALQDDGLTLAFQPIVHGGSYEIESYKCLLRIRGGDGSFVLNLTSRPEDFLFIKSLLDLASGYGLTTVAECVEDAEVADMLSRQGVDYLQGYHFGKPSFDRPWLSNMTRREATSGAVILSPDFRGNR